MRRARWAWAVVICAAAAAGCLPRHAAPTGTTTARSLGPPADGLYVQSVLLERPVGDPLLDRGLWAAGLPAARGATRALLTENGLRAVVLAGNLPAGFQKALDTESETVNPHVLTFGTRKEAVIPTAGPVDPCEYGLLTGLGGKRTEVALRQARCGVLVRPEATTDGRVRLWCEPQVQHGERENRFRPNADGTQFVVEGELPLERYPALGFAVLLGPGEYLLIGWPADQPGTLGAAMFAVEAAGRPRQRVLVIRGGRPDPTPDDLPAVTTPARRPSIAAEASRPVGR